MYNVAEGWLWPHYVKVVLKVHVERTSRGHLTGGGECFVVN